jgi:hypothetical protein
MNSELDSLNLKPFGGARLRCEAGVPPSKKF